MMVRGSCCSGHTVTVTVIAILLQLAVLLSLQIATTADTETVSNGIVSLTVDLKKGCAITSFVDLSSGVNMINTADLGREVQPSFYAGPNNYNSCQWNGQDWPWNPIGAGDSYGHPSKILSVSNDKTSITCSIIPMQWACNNVPCDCTFNMTYSVKDSSVYASVTLINNRADHNSYGKFGQEYPAVYVNGFLYRLFAYVGDKPWTHDSLTEFNTGFDDFWVPGKVTPTEAFVAMATADNFAVGVYNPSSDVEYFLAGFSGKKGSGGTSDSATGYMAPSGAKELEWNEVYTYEYVLVMGNLNDVRNYVYMLHQNGEKGIKLSNLYLKE